MQWRVRRKERVQVRDHVVPPEEGSRPVSVYRKANHFVSVVDGVTARSYRRKGARKRADVPHTSCFPPQEGVSGAICVLRCPNYDAPLVDTARSIELRVVRVSEGAEVGG